MKEYRKEAAYLSITTVILYVITGYGITQYRIVEKLTFGLLQKAWSLRIHNWLIYPLILSLSFHIFYALKNEKVKR